MRREFQEKLVEAGDMALHCQDPSPNLMFPLRIELELREQTNRNVGEHTKMGEI